MPDDFPDEEDFTPASSFQSYYAEGGLLEKQGDFHKAIDAYTKALDLRPGDKHALVARSKCHLRMGHSDNALKDAEESLLQDPNFFKGVLAKAEAEYFKGEFELALVFFHRGHRARPELEEFKLGISKASEAINNSVGNPKDFQFAAPRGARLVQTSNQLNGSTNLLATTWVSPKNGSKKGGTKLLLGELYDDRAYLEEVFEDKAGTFTDKVKDLAKDALDYLNTRKEFWSQQNPLYNRKTKVRTKQAPSNAPDEQTIVAAIVAPATQGTPKRRVPEVKSLEVKPERPSPTSKPLSKGNSNSQKIFDSALTSINSCIKKNDTTTGLRKTKALLAKLPEFKDLDNLERLKAEVLEILGTIYIKLGLEQEGLDTFTSLNKLSIENDFQNLIKTSQDQIDRLRLRIK